MKSRNLAEQPACTITVLDGDDAVVIDGHAALVEVPGGFRDACAAKYGEGFPDGPIWWITPSVVFGFRATDELATSATRWRF
ncbi:MAG: hypothetical protein QM733_13250 [Ilumatobacteraceae bacterium]